MGRRDPADSNTDSPVARVKQFVHKPYPVCVLQQKVSAWIHGDFEERSMLRKAALLRDRSDDIIVYQRQEVILLRNEQQFINEKGRRSPWTTDSPEQQRFVHL